VTVKGTLAGEARGWYRTGAGTFQGDRASTPAISDATLRGHAATAGQERTYTCVPPGSGHRIGVDRDGDGLLDRDELDNGSDPADPTSPAGVTTTSTTSTTSSTLPTGSTPVLGLVFDLKDPGAGSDPSRRRLTLKARDRQGPNLGGDPTFGGAALGLVLTGAAPSSQVIDLPASNWKPIGTTGYRYTDRTGTGAVKSATLRRTGSGVFQLKVVAAGPGIGVVPPNPGTEARAVLAINGGGHFCVGFGGAAGGVIKTNKPTGFKIAGPTAKPPCN
jgi:hypothetical protein